MPCREAGRAPRSTNERTFRRYYLRARQSARPAKHSRECSRPVKAGSSSQTQNNYPTTSSVPESDTGQIQKGRSNWQQFGENKLYRTQWKRVSWLLKNTGPSCLSAGTEERVQLQTGLRIACKDRFLDRNHGMKPCFFLMVLTSGVFYERFTSLGHAGLLGHVRVCLYPAVDLPLICSCRSPFLSMATNLSHPVRCNRDAPQNACMSNGHLHGSTAPLIMAGDFIR